jgi:hypothetical protein
MICALLWRPLDISTIHQSGACMFITFSKVSLKAMFLHNGNKYLSVPLAHAVNMKESYENMKLLLEKIHYEKCKWNICGI